MTHFATEIGGRRSAKSSSVFDFKVEWCNHGSFVYRFRTPVSQAGEMGSIPIRAAFAVSGEFTDFRDHTSFADELGLKLLSYGCRVRFNSEVCN